MLNGMTRWVTNLVRNLVRKDVVDGALDDELTTSVELLTEEKIEAGCSPAEARRLALVQLGGEQVKERVRQARTGYAADQIAQDLRYGLRTLAKAPGFTVVAVVILALGIGLNVTAFGAINALLLRPVPYPSADQLVGLNERAKGSSGNMSVSLANFADWHDRQRVFSALAAYQPTRVSLTGAGEAESVEGLAATAGLFAALGVRPVEGRTFVRGDDQPGAPPVVVISDLLWRRRFDARPLAGSSISVNGVPSTVIGIMPPGFCFPDRAQIWYPLTLNRTTLSRAGHNSWAVARLNPGRTLDDARAEMLSIGHQLAREYPDVNKDIEPLLIPLHEVIVETDIRVAVLASMAAVAFVLLIGCANLANLVLARGSTRGREMAVRSALGAGRGRIVRQLLTESLLLAGAGTAAGLAVGWLGLGAVAASLPADAPLWLRLDIDPTVMGFAALLMLVTTVVFGLAPALRVSRPNLREDLSESGGRTDSGRVSRVQGTLVAVEVALALVLLVCTGLMTRAFLGLLMTDPGFRSKNVMTMRVSLPKASYSSADSLRLFYTNALDAVRQIPGVQHAGAGTRLPSQQANWVPMIIPERTVVRSASGRFPAHAVVATPGYFESLGIRRLHGRTFTPQDSRLDRPGSVIVNRTFAERHWPAGDPIGRRLKYWMGPNEESEWLTVVGVVDDVLNGKGNAPTTTYFPLEQEPTRTMLLVVKASSDPSALVPLIRQQLAHVDRNLPLSQVQSMSAVVDEFLWLPQLFTRLFAVFGFLALVLAAVGVYGVLAYTVSRRTRELGIRAALGADPGQIRRLVLRQGLVPALAGIVIGVGISLGVTRTLRSLLFGVSPTDPLSFVVMTGVLLAAALVACYLPARRASRVDPLVALR